MRYYAQFGEDKVLEKLFPDIGVFLDIGAHNGVTDSNTKMLEERGWNGICVEPHSVFYRALKKNRTAICFNYVIWDENLPSVEFHETAPGGWSRVDGGGEHPTMRVTNPEAVTLDTLLEDYDGTFDFVSIDVEGHEDHVLDGWRTMKRFDPRVVLIEDLSLSGQYKRYFGSYKEVCGWSQGKSGSNVWYLRDEQDYERVKQLYR